MLKKLIALTVIATSVSSFASTQDDVNQMIERTYRESRAKITKALNRKNASNLGKATVFGLLSAAALCNVATSGKAIYQSDRNALKLNLTAGASDEVIAQAKADRLVAVKNISKLAMSVAVAAYAGYKSAQTSVGYLKKTQE